MWQEAVNASHGSAYAPTLAACSQESVKLAEYRGRPHVRVAVPRR